MELMITVRGIANAQAIFDILVGEDVAMRETSVGHYLLTVANAKGTFEQCIANVKALRIPSARVMLVED